MDRAADTLDHGKYVVDGFNALHKHYLATCLRMRSTPEVEKIDSKRMHVDAMTEKGELRFYEECKRFLDLCDGICIKGKCEAKARLKHKYYWIHK